MPWNWYCLWRSIHAGKTSGWVYNSNLYKYYKKYYKENFYLKKESIIKTKFKIAACEQEKYGKGCKHRCTCKNNAICDRKKTKVKRRWNIL